MQHSDGTSDASDASSEKASEKAEKVRVELGGVPETMLWTLLNRAAEARRPDAVLHDPWAVDLVERIDYPFDRTFGPPPAVQAQGQAIRVRCFDDHVRRFLAAHPAGTVVALGEGLETQFWRVDNGRVQWLTVDLPEAVAVRRRLLPDGDRRRTLACSAADVRWVDEVDPAAGVLVTAQGLLMYLHRGDVHRIVAACARRFLGGGMVFDSVPGWFVGLARLGAIRLSGRFRLPPMYWWLDGAERRALRRLHPTITAVRELPLPPGRGVIFREMVPRLTMVPLGEWFLPSINAVDFGGGRR